MPWTSDKSYDWLEGNFFLLHRWDAKVGEGAFIGTEIIGYDEKEGGYFTCFFDNAGFHSKYKVIVDGNIWIFTDSLTRARVTVDEDKNRITFNWEGVSKVPIGCHYATEWQCASNNPVWA